MPEARSGIKPNTHKASSPTTYSIVSILLKNHRGEEVDIQNIVAEFSITESLYSPTLVLSMSFKDSANFIEQYELCGQETVQINLARQSPSSSDVDRVEHLFYVTEYPLYSRLKEHTQVYKLSGVSYHAYVSNLKTVSRAVSGNCVDIIKKVLINDCLYPVDSIVTDDQCITSFKGIIPNLQPLTAIDWLRRRSFADNSDPFFVFEKASSELNIVSLKTLREQEIYRTYRMHSAAFGGVGDEDDFESQACKIRELASEMKMQKILAASHGAFRSRSVSVDIAQKKYSVRDFRYDGNILSPNFKITNLDNSQTVEASIDSFLSCTEFIATNSGNAFNYHDSSIDHIGAARSAELNMDYMSNEITVAGDFTLNAGRRVTLQIPKALDPEYVGAASELDQQVSGDYIVTGVVHKFSSSYFCHVKVKRDSMSYSLL